MDLPYSIESEKQVLANMLFSNEVLIDTLSKLDENDFYDKAHKIIFTTLRKIYSQNQAKVEPFVLIDKLTADGNLDKVGDANYILDLVNSFIDINNANYYINAVHERSILRQLILYSDNVVNKWQADSAGDLTSYINKIDKDVSNITKKRRVEDFISIGTAFNKYKERVGIIKSGEKTANGLLTGYSGFDTLMGGFKDGEVTILAARPSVGKSALALNYLFRTAAKTTRPCVFFSLEMGIEMVTNRLLSAKSAVPMHKIQVASFNDDEERVLGKSIRDMSESRIFIDETPAIKAVDMRAKLTKLQASYGDIGLVVIDYIGLISPDVKPKGDVPRSVLLGEISASLKALARDFHCPLLVLSQLNRKVEENKTKGESRAPVLSDLRESGSIEQDADVVMFIHRPDYGAMTESVNGANGVIDPDAPSDSAVKVIVAKNRNGSLPTFDMVFQKHIGRFVEVAKQ